MLVRQQQTLLNERKMKGRTVLVIVVIVIMILVVREWKSEKSGRIGIESPSKKKLVKVFVTELSTEVNSK